VELSAERTRHSAELAHAQAAVDSAAEATRGRMQVCMTRVWQARVSPTRVCVWVRV
jgi:hypothetical protein